jgi:hypothetical protein
MASRRFRVIHPVHTTYDDDGFHQEETSGVLGEAGEFRDKSRETR